ncbi:MAG: hypothetical protein IJQ62_12230 [Clostridia bacterium]|nr:hypothetical protein [Clostridia bacterium]
MTADLLRMLAAAEDDVSQGRVAPVEETFRDIRAALLAGKTKQGVSSIRNKNI